MSFFLSIFQIIFIDFTSATLTMKSYNPTNGLIAILIAAVYTPIMNPRIWFFLQPSRGK